MGARLGPGPVFVYEWLTTTRRWQFYAMRAGFMTTILVGMVVAWQSLAHVHGAGETVSLAELASYGESIFTTIATIELALVLLAAPAATAGAICLDKARGTLDHMLVTDLTNSEIVLGKLCVRLAPVLGLIACVLPLTALAGLLGGIDPWSLLGSFLVAIGSAFLGCSLALTLSVWGRKTHDVLVLTYLILILWICSPLLVTIVSPLLTFTPWGFWPGLWDWITNTNPFYLVVVPSVAPGRVSMPAYFGFLLFCLCLSGALMGVATLRIRRVASKQAGKLQASARRFRFGQRLSRLCWHPRFPRTLLDANPVLWREWHWSNLSWFLGLAWFLYATLGVLLVVTSFRLFTSPSGAGGLIVFMSTLQVAVGLLLLSMSAGASLAEERARGSLDVLLSTPLSTFSIVVGKWWGGFRLAPHLVVWPAILGGLLVIDGGSWIAYLLLLGLILAYCTVLTSLGLALATWVSRPGRVASICVSAYVLFSFGWLFLGIVAFPRDDLGLLVLMGSPLVGTPLSTAAVGSSQHRLLGSEDRFVWLGAIVWILVSTGAAAIIFGAVIATFDRCLGRLSEIPESSAAGPGTKQPYHWQPDPSQWYADGRAKETGAIPDELEQIA